MLKTFVDSIDRYLPCVPIEYHFVAFCLFIFSLAFYYYRKNNHILSRSMFVTYIFYLITITILTRKRNAYAKTVLELFWTYKYIGRGGDKTIL